MSRRGRPVPHELVPRYRGIIQHWNLFAETCDLPLPTSIRANTLRASRADVADRLRDAGIGVEDVSWNGTLMQVDRPVGRRIEHWLGLFYIQEATQTVPVLVLDPQPGETVLDLCAAPGGKTSQAAALMHNRGHLVANEPSGRRQQALLANLNRIGALNVTVTEYRGESFPLGAQFDRVLVDAPCSAEGTLRKNRSVRNGGTASAIRRLSGLQKRLIVRAFDLVRPGGRLVYSTCTFAPEENEGVVAHLLRERSAVILPTALPFSAAPGILEWERETFPSEIAACSRIYPHHLDSGGGFIAHVERPVE
ncbi:MAG: RsmB/NOP family class I SAM-dependent RNA methyltransferase [Candidatus Bipolaricaulia bacterium]